MKIEDQAFPTPATFGLAGEMYTGQIGLTKREHFASLAMQGILANSSTRKGSDHDMEEFFRKQLIKESVSYADALIAELNKPVS